MNLVDIIVIAILAVLIGGAIAYIIKAKKNGQKCIGCPHSKQCSNAQNGKSCSGSCHCNENKYDDDCYKIKVDI